MTQLEQFVQEPTKLKKPKKVELLMYVPQGVKFLGTQTQ